MYLLQDENDTSQGRPVGFNISDNNNKYLDKNDSKRFENVILSRNIHKKPQSS